MATVNVNVVVIHTNQYQQRQQEQARAKPIEHYKTPEGIPGINFQGRRCTDPLMCCMFVSWIILMLGISAFAFSKGDLEKVAHKFDMYGTNCTIEHPRKLFTNLIDLDPIGAAKAAGELAKDSKEK